MPYKAFKEGRNKFCVYSLNADGSRKNNHGCHPSMDEANNQVRAMYANDAEATKKEAGNMMMPDMSAWGLTPDQAQQTGTLLTLFNGKVHEAFTCVTDQLSMRGYLSESDIKLFTDIKGEMLRLFNQQIPPALAELQIPSDVLNAIASKELHELDSQFVTMKEADSPYDWAMITSSAYRDREGQIVSREAHRKDIAFMQETGNYGTLDWWHLHPVVFQYLEKKEAVAKLPQSVQDNGIIVGDCTFSELYNNVRLEAGTYRSKEVADALNADAANLSASLLFFRPLTEPDANGIYHTIHTISRAIMPRTKVSNFAPLLSSAALAGAN